MPRTRTAIRHRFIIRPTYRRCTNELRQDAALAARELRRSPGFTVVATLTLALGITAVTAVFAVVDATMLRSLPFQEPNGLVLVRRAQPGSKAPVETTYPEYRDVRDGTRVQWPRPRAVHRAGHHRGTAVAVLAAAIPARRALRVDPVTVLRAGSARPARSSRNGPARTQRVASMRRRL